MEKVILNRDEFAKMGEYSCNLPTGTILGKIWKCNRLAYAEPPGEDWFMGEYAPDPKAKIGKDGQPETVLIVWRKIEVR